MWLLTVFFLIIATTVALADTMCEAPRNAFEADLCVVSHRLQSPEIDPSAIPPGVRALTRSTAVYIDPWADRMQAYQDCKLWRHDLPKDCGRALWKARAMASDTTGMWDPVWINKTLGICKYFKTMPGTCEGFARRMESEAYARANEIRAGNWKRVREWQAKP